MLNDLAVQQMELTYDEVTSAHEQGEQAYMRAIEEFGREFSHADMTRCIEFFVEAARNTKFVALHS